MNSGAHSRILLVDDNPSVRAAIRSFFLSETKFDVCGEAQDGLSALQKAKELRPDVIVMDLSLPLLNGAEVSAAVKSELSGIKVVAFSMYADELGKAIAPTFRIDAMLPKALGVKALAETIERLLGCHSMPL